MSERNEKRDDLILDEIGHVEDRITRLLSRIEKAEQSAREQGAEGHEQFYYQLGQYLGCAQGDFVSAYTLMLNGDEENGVLPLDR